MTTGLTQEMAGIDVAMGEVVASMSEATQHVDISLLQELLESHIVSYSEVVGAAHAISPHSLAPQDTFNSWADMKHTLDALGFGVACEVGWVLGLAPMGGHLPSIEAVEQRFQFAMLLLSGASHKNWDEANVKAVSDFKRKLEASKASCLAEIMVAPATKIGVKGPVWGRWFEAGQDLLSQLSTQFPGAALGLQLSSLFGRQYGWNVSSGVWGCKIDPRSSHER